MVYSVDRLRRDVGWVPEYTFPATAEQTYDWYRREAIHDSTSFDFAFEDQLMELVAASGR